MALLGFDEDTKKNILRFEQLKKYTTTPILLFGKLLGEPENVDDTTDKIRKYYFHIQVVDRIDDLKVDDIREAAIKALNGTKLEVTDEMRSLQCELDNINPVFFDDKLNVFVGACRFKLKTLKLN